MTGGGGKAIQRIKRAKEGLKRRSSRRGRVIGRVIFKGKERGCH